MLNFPVNPAPNEVYPNPPIYGYPQFQWDSVASVWRRLTPGVTKATEETIGGLEIATQTEVNVGADDDDRIVTPATLNTFVTSSYFKDILEDHLGDITLPDSPNGASGVLSPNGLLLPLGVIANTNLPFILNDDTDSSFIIAGGAREDNTNPNPSIRVIAKIDGFSGEVIWAKKVTLPPGSRSLYIKKDTTDNSIIIAAIHFFDDGVLPNNDSLYLFRMNSSGTLSANAIAMGASDTNSSDIGYSLNQNIAIIGDNVYVQRIRPGQTLSDPAHIFISKFPKDLSSASSSSTIFSWQFTNYRYNTSITPSSYDFFLVEVGQYLYQIVTVKSGWYGREEIFIHKIDTSNNTSQSYALVCSKRISVTDVKVINTSIYLGCICHPSGLTFQDIGVIVINSLNDTISDSYFYENRRLNDTRISSMFDSDGVYFVNRRDLYDDNGNLYFDTIKITNQSAEYLTSCIAPVDTDPFHFSNSVYINNNLILTSTISNNTVLVKYPKTLDRTFRFDVGEAKYTMDISIKSPLERNASITFTKTSVTTTPSTLSINTGNHLYNEFNVTNGFYFDDINLPTRPFSFPMGGVVQQEAIYKFTIASSTNVSITTGSKTFSFTLLPNEQIPFFVGQRLRAASNSNNYMEGIVTELTENSVTINIDYFLGEGTHANWVIGITGSISSPVSSPDIITNLLLSSMEDNHRESIEMNQLIYSLIF